MGLIKDKLANLKEADLYSIILFALAKLRDIPDYTALSELCYILDKKSLVKVCQIFGGMTLQIPTLEELELMSYALLLYEYVDIHNIAFDEAVKSLDISSISLKHLKDTYYSVKQLLSDYNLSSRGAT